MLNLSQFIAEVSMENKIYLYTNEGNKQMMSFVITTQDGRVIVIDGGYDNDAPKLMEALQKITGEKKPHVDAWFLTHAHDDHISAFGVFYEEYLEGFTCDAVYYTFPSVQYFQKYDILLRFQNYLQHLRELRL